MITEFEQGAKRRMRILARLKELAVIVAESSASNEIGDQAISAHIEADPLLVEYLEIIGAADLVVAYKAIIGPEQPS